MRSHQELVAIATQIREHIITMLLQAGSGHAAGSLGMADVFTALYFGELVRYQAHRPDWPDRDFVLLSNGHICPVWYATLAVAGYFPESELASLRSFESRLQGHPHLGSIPGVENTSGPLGQGLSQAVGLALSLRRQSRRNEVFCLLSDGEHQEGQTWEAYQAAGHFRLANLTVLIDRNTIQIDGFTEQVMPLEPFNEKLGSFGWQVLEVDGHNIQAVIDAVNHAKAIQEQPVAIVCNTIPGKGVEFMENLPEWHGKAPSFPDSIAALRQLRSLADRITE